MCRNESDVCVLILYSDTLSNSLMSASSFLVESLEFYMSSVMLSAHGDSLTTSTPIWIPFTPFWIAVTRLLTLCLNKTGDSGHTCLVPDLRGKAFRFSLLSMMLAVGLSYIAFIMLRQYYILIG